MAKGQRPTTATQPSIPKENPVNKYKPNGWGMIQNVMIHAMNKGQLLLAIFGLIILMSIAKLNSVDLLKILHEIFTMVKSLEYFGWVFASMILAAWYFIGSRSNKVHIEQINKLLEENEKLHQDLLLRA